MENKLQIIELIKAYEMEFPGEAPRTKAIKTFMEEFNCVNLFDRKNFIGHITASAYVLNPAKDALLLLKHKALKIWLQPGGHVDGNMIGVWQWVWPGYAELLAAVEFTLPVDLVFNSRFQPLVVQALVRRFSCREHFGKETLSARISFGGVDGE